MDVDVIMNWPIEKMKYYMAYYLSETEEFKDKVKEESLTPKMRQDLLLQFLKSR